MNKILSLEQAECMCTALAALSSVGATVQGICIRYPDSQLGEMVVRVGQYSSGRIYIWKNRVIPVSPIEPFLIPNEMSVGQELYADVEVMRAAYNLDL